MQQNVLEKQQNYVDLKNLSKNDAKYLYEKARYMMLQSAKQKIDMLSKKTALFSGEDLFQDAFLKLLNATKEKNLKFDCIQKLSAYFNKTLFNHIRLKHRDYAFIKKYNADIVSIDAPASALTVGSANDESTVTVLDKISADNMYVMNETCLDLLHILRKKYYLNMKKHTNKASSQWVDNRSYLEISEELKDSKDYVNMDLNLVLFDMYSLDIKELKEKYSNKNIYLSKPMVEKIQTMARQMVEEVA
jgi:hypothetical protein